MKLYQSEPWLRRKYVNEKKTAKEIAEMCGVTEMTVFRHLEKFGLIRNSRTWSQKRR
jgi:DNA-directed RNA polymerase specialized sigma subunit